MKKTEINKMKQGFSNISVVIIWLVGCCELGSPSQEVARLYEDLMTNYNKLARPVRNASCPVKIMFKMRLTQLADVHEKNQVVTINGYLVHIWHDYRLMWDRAEYGGVKVMHIPTNMIWLPDIILYNNAHGSPQVTTMTKAHIYPSGYIIWEPPVIYNFLCSIDIQWFPYDEQHCEMKFGSWTYYGSQVDLVQPITDEVDIEQVLNPVSGKNETSWVVKHGADITEFTESVEWDLMSVESHRHVRWYPCCDYPYIDITYEIDIRRKTLFYTINLVTPCVGITFLTCLVFYLPSDSNNKITLCISILVTMTVFFLLLVEIIPPTSLTIPLIGRYLTFTMIMVTSSIGCTILILNIHHQSITAVRPVPVVVRRVFIDCLPRILCLQRPAKVEEVDNELMARNRTAHIRDMFSRAVPFIHKMEQPDTTGMDLKTKTLSLALHKACHNVCFIANNMREQHRMSVLKDDWKYAAIVVDRVFLLIFSITILVGTVWVILSAPSLHDHRLPVTQINISKIEPSLDSINKTISLTDMCNYDLISAIAAQMASGGFHG